MFLNDNLSIVPLKDQLAAVLDELKRIEAGRSVDDELLENINLITRTLQGLNK